MSPRRSQEETVQELGRYLMAAEDPVVRANDPALLEEAIEALRRVVSPDFVFALVPEVGGTSTEWAGVEGFVEGWHDWLNGFDGFRIMLGEQTSVGDKVALKAQMTAIPKGTTATIEGNAVAVFTFNGDTVRRMEFHLEQGAAFRGGRPQG